MKIAGRYEITAKVGQGGTGVVYRADDPAPMDREVAVKSLHEFADPLSLAHDGVRQGTLLYMAPEQLQHKPVSAQNRISTRSASRRTKR